MGFSTGFIGGLTLTYSLLYLSLHLHRLNRLNQHNLLVQKAALLNSIVEPLPALPEQPVYEVKKHSVTEMLKDRWNREIEETVKNVQETDWRRVREGWEERVGDVWRRVSK